jgi:hypothetical protein
VDRKVSGPQARVGVGLEWLECDIKKSRGLKEAEWMNMSTPFHLQR